MAALVEQRPVIVLASGRDSPPWLAFCVAHELGHIMLGHVRPDDRAWIDVQIRDPDHGARERAADRFACEVLTGSPEPSIPGLGLKAIPLALRAGQEGPSSGVDPGVYALIYAKTNDRWPVAQKALKYLGLATGGKAMIDRHVAAHLSRAELPEAEERFLRGLTASAG